jgi:hypothetical protein
MRLGRYRRLFCSQLVRQAYEAASGGKLKLPTFTTRFVTSNQDFLHRIGVKAKETFAPGDIELQPDFDLVAEWGDYRVTPRLRAQDLIMTKLFEWMEEHRWRFKEDFLVRVIAWFGRLSAHFSERIKDMISSVVPKVPVNMRRRTVATVVMLHQTAQPLFEEIERLERDSLEHLGRPLHPRDVYAHMDKVRKISEGQVGYLRAP